MMALTGELEGTRQKAVERADGEKRRWGVGVLNDLLRGPILEHWPPVSFLPAEPGPG